MNQKKQDALLGILFFNGDRLQSRNVPFGTSGDSLHI